MLTQVGVAEDGTKIMTGVFEFNDTHGLPLMIVLDRLRQCNMMPDWIAFYHAAMNAGWKERTVYAKLEEAICDIYGKEFLDGWRKLMLQYTEGIK